ncbi:hypothetical protein FA13DRAFT_1724059 [Coprinellus micaceus]|uniref:Uncharacterized protein n=1 Tax=Coprinellus micaceus TaxID=71717 RepID=A0A4Y7U098_COPMI|nr:hypothetical protein FA13DRAFT_1724059 [Coprinellus micaceus]
MTITTSFRCVRPSGPLCGDLPLLLITWILALRPLLTPDPPHRALCDQQTRQGEAESLYPSYPFR